MKAVLIIIAMYNAPFVRMHEFDSFTACKAAAEWAVRAEPSNVKANCFLK